MSAPHSRVVASFTSTIGRTCLASSSTRDGFFPRSCSSHLPSLRPGPHETLNPSGFGSVPLTSPSSRTRSEKKGRETSLRLEQMRNMFSQLFLKSKLQMPEPLDVIALQSDEEYIRVAPLRQGSTHFRPGIFSAGRRSQLHRPRSGRRGQLAGRLSRLCAPASELQLSPDSGMVRRRLCAIFLQPAAWATVRHRWAAIPSQKHALEPSSGLARRPNHLRNC